MICFDTETGSLPVAQLESRIPQFEAPANYKDEEKIAAHIAKKRVDWMEQAALDATTGQILAIGVFNVGKDSLHFLTGEECDILAAFSGVIMHSGGTGVPLVGWNIFGFDMPFIIRRAWILGVPLPHWIRQGRYWDRCFVDLMDVWALGNREQRVSLDVAASSLGVGRKSGNGAHFAQLWNGSDEERAQALNYLENDLRLTAGVAARIMLPDAQALSKEAA